MSAQFRYGAAQKSQRLHSAFSGTTTTTHVPFHGTATGSQSLREDHWLVDFNVRRDLGVGNGNNAQWTLGVRVADLRSKLNANRLFTAHGVGGAGTSTAAPFNDQQKSTFLGAGPRLGVVGETPLGGN